MTPLLAALLLALQPQDTALVTAELVPRVAHVGEAVVLRVSVQSRSGSTPRIDQPTLHPSLHTVGTQDFTEMSFGLNRRNATTTRREFVLMPQTPGTFTIPSLRVMVGRRLYRTGTLTLQVSGTVPEPREAPENADARVTVRMEPETVYVGQQSTLVGEVLLTPDLQMRLTRPPSYDAPAPADFWIQELTPDPSTDVRVIDGQRFIVQRFYRAYFPLTPGRFSFAPARVTYEARQGFLFAPQTRELRSASPRVTVLAVPEDTRPQSFRGAVGALSMTATVEPRTGAVGDAVALIVELTGTGNVKALPPPTLPNLPGFEVLDPSETSDLDARTHKLGGTKRFTWVLVPEREGNFDLPAIGYASFDPELRTFRTHVADPGGVSVLPAGTGAPARTVGLRPQPEPNSLGWVHSPLFLTAQVLPLAFLGLGLWVRRRRAGPPARLKRGWDQRLAALRAARINPLTHAERLLRDVLAEVVPGARVRSGSPTELQSDLRRLVSQDFAERVAHLLERLEHARYAPVEADGTERKRILDELGEVLNAAWQRARTHTTTRAALVPIMLAFWQAATPANTFDQGISAFRERHLEAAVQHFERYVREAPNDPAGWYNLAVSYEAQRRPAGAAWALLHTLELRPRADDIEAQLRRLGATRLGQRMEPLLKLNTEETWLLACALWWGAATLLSAAIVRRKRRLAFSALIPLALAGLLLLTWGIERALPPPAIVLDAGAPLLVGQSLHADVVRQLQPLSAVSIIEEKDGWSRVRTPAGESGWVSDDALGRFR